MQFHPVFAKLVPNPFIIYSVANGDVAITTIWGRVIKSAPLEGALFEVQGGGLFSLGVGDLVIRGPNRTDVTWKNIANVKRVRETLEGLQRDDGSEAHEAHEAHEQDEGSVFRNKKPEKWAKPYPDILPEAHKWRTSEHGHKFNSRMIRAMAVSSDGSHLVAGADNGSVYLIDPADGRLMKSVSVPVRQTGGRGIRGLAVGREGRWVVTVGQSGDHEVLLWETDKETPSYRVMRASDHGDSRHLGAGLSPGSLSISNDEKWIATCDGGLYVGPLRNTDGNLAPDLRRSGDRANEPDVIDWIRGDAVAFHPEGKWLALSDSSNGLTSSWGSDITFYNPKLDGWFGKSYWRSSSFVRRHESGVPARYARTVQRLRGTIGEMATDGKGRVLATLSHDAVTLFQVDQSGKSFHGEDRVNLKELRRCMPNTGFSLNRFCLSGDARLVVAAASQKDQEKPDNTARIYVWNAIDGRALAKLTIYEHQEKLGRCSMTIDGIALHPNGRWLFSGGNGGVIRRWVIAEKNGQLSAYCDMAMEALPDGNWVVWRDPDGENRCWVNPSTEAQRWLGWRMPSNGDFADFSSFDTFIC